MAEFKKGGVWELTNSSTLSYYFMDGTTKKYKFKITGLVGLTEDIISGEGEDNSVNFIEFTENDVKKTTTDSEGKETTEIVGVEAIVKITNSEYLGTSKISISSPTANYAYTLDLSDDDKVKIDDTETGTYSAKDGKYTITANLTKGFTIAADGKSASYSDKKTGQTLATITGLQKNADESTIEFEAFNGETGRGTVTLSLPDAEGETSVLGTSDVKITMDNVAKNNRIYYELALGGEDYAQTAEDEQLFWSVNKTTATYKSYFPTGYTTADPEKFANSDVEDVRERGLVTTINVTKEKTTDLVTVSGLAENISSNGVVDKAENDNGTITFNTNDASVGKLSDPENNDSYVAGLTAVRTKEPEYVTANGKTTLKENGSGTITVTVDASVLPTKGDVTIKTAKDYTTTAEWAAKNTIPTADKIVQANGTVETANIWVISGNKATYKTVQLTYYTIHNDKGKIVCTAQKDVKTLATITGLSKDYLADTSKLTVDNDGRIVSGVNTGLITDIKDITIKSSPEYNDPDAKGKVTLKTAGVIEIGKDLLAGANVTIGKSEDYKLAVDDSIAPTFSNQKWNLSGTTATLKGTIDEGYSASDDGKTIVYTASNTNQTLATISGLAKGIKLITTEDDTTGDKANSRQIGTYIVNDSGEKDWAQGISESSDPYTASSKIPITISKNVLGTSKVSIKSTFYKLSIDDDSSNEKLYVPVLEDAATQNIGWHGSLASTATLKRANKAYYTLAEDGSAITYTKETNATTLATIKGLNSKITEDDIEIDEGNHVITLKTANAVTNSNVTITMPKGADTTTWTLALKNGVEGLTAAELDNKKWTQSSNTVTYKADVIAGYKKSEDGSSIIYTKTGSNTTLATISGVSPGLTRASGDESEPYDGIEIDEEKGTIKLKSSVLNNATVKVTGNYQLIINDDVQTDPSAEYEIPTASKVMDSWVINGTTATFKKVNTAYYTYDKAKNTLTYVAPTDVKYGAYVEDGTPTATNPYPAPTKALEGKPIVYATVKGLASNLKVSSDGTKLGTYVNDDFKEGLGFGEDAATEKDIIITDSNVLTTTNVTFDTKNTQSAYSKLYIADDAFEDDSTGISAPTQDENDNPEWSFKSGTASYIGKISAGYTNNDDRNAITYQAANNSATLVTVSGLINDKSLDDNILNDSSKGFNVSGTTITLRKAMLGTTDVKLTTNVPVNGENYQFDLDDDVVEATDATTYDNFWTVDKTTAVCGTWIDTHYELGDTDDDDDNGTNNILRYCAEGVAETSKTVKLEGLVSGLNPKKDGSINGITLSDTTIKLSNNVLDDKTVTFKPLNNSGYTLEMGDDVPKSTDSAAECHIITAGDATNNTSAEVDIREVNPAGYKVEDADADGVIKLTYTPKTTTATSNKQLANIKGLKPGITKNDDGSIDGITIEDTTVTLSKSVLGSTTVNFSSSHGYTLAVDSTVKESESNGFGWTAVDSNDSSKDFYLRSGVVTEGWKLSGNTITHTPAGTSGTIVATITGLKDKITVSDLNDGIDVTSNTVTLSKSVLGTNPATKVELKNESGQSYKLALNQVDETDTANYVPDTGETAVWDYDQSKGTATFTQTVEEGYKLGDNDTTVTYMPLSTITTTFTNLSKEDGEITVNEKDADGKNTITGITYNDGVFTFGSKDILASKAVKLTTKVSKGVVPNYTIALAEDVAAESYDPVWNKKNTEEKATCTQTTKAGYTLSEDEKTINFNSDPTTATLATVTGLKKEIAAENGLIEGLKVTVEPTKSDGTVNKGTIKISNSVLNAKDVSLGKDDKYKFELDTTDPIPQKAPNQATVNGKQVDVGAESSMWTINGSTATYKDVYGAFYALNDDGNKLSYNKEIDKATIVTITGLDKTKLAECYDKGTIDEVLAINDTNHTVTISGSVLGSSDVKLTVPSGSTAYTFVLGSDVMSQEGTWENQTEWVTSGTTATLKTYDKAYYKLEGADTIKVNKENVTATHATVSGIKSGEDITDCFEPTNSSDFSKGGTIKLSSAKLDGKKVTLSIKNKSDYKLALNTDVTVSTIEKNTAAFTTNKTTAILTATQKEGYFLSEDGKTINYFDKDTANQTIATVSGIVSGATINLTDVTTDSETGISTITLGNGQLGTTKVTVKGDYYKLAIANGYESATDDPEWIKSKGSDKATYTQTTDIGFTVADEGKTLNYLSKVTKVDLATLSGLNKDLTADDLGTTGDGETDLVELDETNKKITVKKDALSKGALKLGAKDEYSLDLDDSEDFVAKEVAEHWDYSKGTASIVKGTSEGWEETNNKEIGYTKEVKTIVSTIKGLPTNLEYDSIKTDLSGLTGLTVETGTGDAASSIKASAEALAGIKKVELKNSNDAKYVLTLADESLKPDYKTENKWNLSKTNATLKSYGSDGYEIDQTGLIITPKAGSIGSSLAEITGLPTGLVEKDGVICTTVKSGSTTEYATGITIDSDAPTQLELSNDLLSKMTTTTPIKITSGNYTIKDTFDGASPGTVTLDAASDIAKGNVFVSKSVTGGYDLSDGNKTLTRTADGVETYATISGIKKNFEWSNHLQDLQFNESSTVVTVGAEALDTSNVTIKVPSKGTQYTLALNSNVNSTLNGNKSEWNSTWKNQTEWVIDNGTATYKTYDKANYYMKDSTNTTIVYAAPTKGTAYASVSGLKKTATAFSGADASGVISLTEDMLDTSKVTLKITKVNTSKLTGDVATAAEEGNEKAATFKLALNIADSLKSDEENAVWDTNGTTAKLTGTITKGYKLSTDKMSVTYQAEDKDDQVIATVSNLKAGSEVFASDVSTDATDSTIRKITLDNNRLGNKSVTLKGEGYKFALKEEVITTDESAQWENQTEWVTSGTTSTYKKYDKEHYDVNATGNQINYYAAADIKGKGETYTKVSGIVSGVSIGGSEFDNVENILTLDKKIVGTSTKVQLTDYGYGYRLALGDDFKDSLSTVISDETVLTAKADNTAVTLKGSLSIGYSVSNDGLTASYASKKATGQTIAEFSGLDKTNSITSDDFNGDTKYDSTTNTFTLKKADINSNSITIAGGTAQFSFASDYDGSITGSKNADKITVAGTGVSITAGKGNDIVDLGDGKATFFYASGNGNDIIKNFSIGTDAIEITNVAKDKVSIDKHANGKDVIVTVDKAKLVVKGIAVEANLTNFSVKASDGNVTYTEPVATPDVLADDNYELTPQLSSIVNNSSSYTADDVGATQDITALDKQSTALAYGGKK